jgi:outer membrane receptor protein involved in Fe transport
LSTGALALESAPAADNSASPGNPPPQPAAAEDQLQEVVVTATKRSENMQSVPIAAMTIPQARLESLGVRDLVGLTEISSSLTVQDLVYQEVFMRGVGTTVPGAGLYASVATYIDGIYIPRTTSLGEGITNYEFADSVVVLKGPQGSLYGRNATGGAIVITTHTPHPGDPLSVTMNGSFGNYNNRQLNGMIAGGINDFSAFSLTATVHKANGYIRDLTDNSTGADKDLSGFSGKLMLQPDEDTSLELSAKWARNESRYQLLQQIGQGVPGPIPGLNAPQSVYAGVLIGKGLPAAEAISLASGLRFSTEPGTTYDNTTTFPYPGLGLPKSSYYNEDSIFAATFKRHFQAFDFVSITGYSHNLYNAQAEALLGDPTSVPAQYPPVLGFPSTNKSWATQQELELVSNHGPIQWITGANYFRESGPTAEASDTLGTISFVSADRWTVSSAALYGEATVPIGDFAATVGARYTRDIYKLDDDTNTELTGNPNAGHRSRRDGSFTPSGKLTYHINPDDLVYGSVTTGFKSGTLNPQNPLAGSAAPEKITSYEIGAKTELFERRVRLNVAAFDYDWRDIQLSVLVPGSSTFLINGTSARILGAEAELEWILSRRISFHVDGTYLHSHYNSNAVLQPLVGPPGVLEIAGHDVAGAPKGSANFSFDWTFANLPSGSLKLSPMVRWSSGWWINAESTIGTGGLNDNGFTTVDANLSYTSDDGHWVAALWTTNVFNEKYYPVGLDAAGQLLRIVSLGRPREYGLRLSLKF